MDPLLHIGLLLIISILFLWTVFKIRHEGFSDIVNPAVRSAMGESNAEYIRQSAAKFNPLMNLMNTLRNPLLPQNYSEDDAKAKQETVRQALRAPMASPNNPSFDVDSSNVDDILIDRNSKGSARQSIIDAEKIKTIDCSAFDNSDFAQTAGICHEGGYDSGGNPMIGGLYLSEDDKESAQITAKRMNSKEVNYKPTVGKCASYRFSTSKEQCQTIQNEMNCVKQQSFNTKGCGVCLQDDTFHYIEPDAIYNPPSFQVVGTGSLTVTSPSSTDPIKITLSSTPQEVELSSLKEGDIVQFNVTPETASLSGYLIGQTNGGDYRIDILRLVQNDLVTNARPRLSGQVEINGENYSVMRPGRGKTSMNISVLNTFSFLDPSEYAAQKCGSSPYIKKESNLTFLNSSPCYKKGQAPGSYSLECLQQTFQSAGCSVEGKAYPATSALATALMTSDNGVLLNIGAIAQKIYTYSLLAYTGKDSNGNTLSIPDWNMYNEFCTGKTITSPCDISIQNGGPISTDCLSYLWQNAGANVKNGIGSTYTNTPMASSLNDNNKDRFCTTKGTMSPIDSAGKQNQTAIDSARALGNVNAIQSFYDKIHRTANNNMLSDDMRKEAVQQCYGVRFMPKPVIKKQVPIVTLWASCNKGQGWQKNLEGPGTYIKDKDFPSDASYAVVSPTLTALLFAPGGVEVITGPGEFNFCNKGGFNDLVQKIVVTKAAPVPYSNSTTYKEGDIVFFNSNYYKMVEGAGQPGYAPNRVGDRLWSKL